MTREEAIKILTEIQTKHKKYIGQTECNNALNMAIEALQAKTDGDLISRKDAMGAVQDHFNADGFKGYYDGQKMMDRITALPSAEADWIPCSERLPNEERHYLCCYKGYLPFIAHYHDGQWHCIDGTTHVHAWMPLPEPYKGGDPE